VHRANGREQLTFDMNADEVVAMQRTFDEIQVQIDKMMK
jgi:hypothetical protein